MPAPVELPPWVFGYALFFGAVHVVLLYYLYRTARTTGTSRSGTAARAEAESIDPEDRVVRCEHCGAENEPGYRYCHNCVEELPGALDRAGSSGVPSGRGIL